MQDQTLTPADTHSATWRRLTQILTARLQDLRESNDRLGLDPAKTEAIRGQIAEVKRTLALADEASADAEGIPVEWTATLPAATGRDDR